MIFYHHWRARALVHFATHYSDSHMHKDMFCKYNVISFAFYCFSTPIRLLVLDYTDDERDAQEEKETKNGKPVHDEYHLFSIQIDYYYKHHSNA